MKDSHFTRQERNVIHWLRFLTLTYFGAAILLGFIPDLFLTYLANIGRVFFNFHGVPLGRTGWDFWQVFSLVFLALLGWTAFRAQRDWLRFAPFVPLILFAKGFCTLGFLAILFWGPPHFFYIVGALFDGVLFFLTWYTYAQAIHSRPAISPHPS